MIKLALVDDHTMMRKSLAMLISSISSVTIVFEADNGHHCIEQLAQHCVPDILLLDISMPVMDGLQTAIWLRRKYPRIKILVLTMVFNERMLSHMIKTGARGYLLKDTEPNELMTAIAAIYHDGYYYNDWFTEKHTSKEFLNSIAALNSQEIIFLKWASTDLTYKQIALEMQVSPRTVDGFRDSLFEKLRLRSRIDILLYAIKNGFVEVYPNPPSLR